VADPNPPSVSRLPATCYTVRNGWAWAHIFVRCGEEKPKDAEASRHWAYVSIISDFGEFGHCWTHMGEDWRSFMPGLDMDYAMKKFLGQRFRVPLSIDEAEKQGRKAILQYRREGNLDAGDARTLWDSLSAADRNGSLDSFLRSWDDHSYGRWYALDWWDHRWDKVNPQAEAFWREIWPHFTAAIKQADQTASAA